MEAQNEKRMAEVEVNRLADLAARAGNSKGSASSDGAGSYSVISTGSEAPLRGNRKLNKDPMGPVGGYKVTDSDIPGTLLKKLANLGSSVCYCGKAPRVLTCRMAGPNHLRHFAKCAQQEEEMQCGWFMWLEERSAAANLKAAASVQLPSDEEEELIPVPVTPIPKTAEEAQRLKFEGPAKVKVCGNDALLPAGKLIQTIEVEKLPQKVRLCDHLYSGVGSNSKASRLTCVHCGLRGIQYHGVDGQGDTRPGVWMIADLKAEAAEAEKNKQKKAAAKAKSNDLLKQMNKALEGKK